MRNEFDGVVIEDQQVVEEGVYCQNLTVNGIAEFMAEVEADFIDINGEACFDTYVTCDKFTVKQRCICKEGIFTSSMRILGAMAVYGRINSETVFVRGALKFRDTLRTATLSVRMESLVKGSGKLRAARCMINGVLNNSGVVQAEDFIISGNKTSRVHEIRCDILRVKYNQMYNEYKENNKKESGETFLLVSEFVDCFEADIEYCNIEKLYCDSAIIRKGCMIQEVLYRDSIEIEQGARVERLSKT